MATEETYRGKRIGFSLSTPIPFSMKPASVIVVICMDIASSSILRSVARTATSTFSYIEMTLAHIMTPSKRSLVIAKLYGIIALGQKYGRV